MQKQFYSLLFFFTAFLTNTVYSQEAVPPPPQREQGFWQTMIMISVALVFFYFILWRPEQKRRKELDTQRDSMQQGDRVIAMGIIGTVVRVQEETVILKMYDGAKIEVLKGAITETQPNSKATNGNKQVKLADTGAK
jgi:preprotein translocase subunit YajC